MAYNQFSYSQADRNRDGVLDRNEFRNFLDFQSADWNHDGRVNLAEFAQIAAPNLNIHPRNAARAFQIADQNYDGVLDQRELANFSDFQHADLNQDGRVDPVEMNLFIGRGQSHPNPPVIHQRQYYPPYGYPRRRHC